MTAPTALAPATDPVRISHMVVERPGLLTTVQDWPGRTGYWHVGVPPSGPMDDLSFRLGNRVLDNEEGAAGLECTMAGPALRFAVPTWVCVTGAPVEVTVTGRRVPLWRPVLVPADGLLDIGMTQGPGMRCYVLVSGGVAVPEYLGSAATFTLGGVRRRDRSRPRRRRYPAARPGRARSVGRGARR